MNEILARFLNEKQANASRLSASFCEKQEDVIASFGGITNMIELCLTNPNASKYIDTDCKQFDSLRKILKLNDDSSDSALKKNRSISLIKIYDDENINDINTHIHTHTHNYNHNQLQQIQTVKTVAEYYHSTLILDCDARNSLLFKLIKNGNTASYLHNKILSKTLFMIVFCSVFIGFGSGILRYYVRYLHS